MIQRTEYYNAIKFYRSLALAICKSGHRMRHRRYDRNSVTVKHTHCYTHTHTHNDCAQIERA